MVRVASLAVVRVASLAVVRVASLAVVRMASLAVVRVASLAVVRMASLAVVRVAPLAVISAVHWFTTSFLQGGRCRKAMLGEGASPSVRYSSKSTRLSSLCVTCPTQ